MTEPASHQPAVSRRRLLRLTGRAVIAASVIFIAVDLARRFDAADVSLHIGWILAALLPAALGVFVQAWAWRSLIRSLSGRELPWLEATSVYLDAQLARYTPGKVGLLAVRIAAAPRLGVSTRLMVGALLIELLSWVGVGVLVGFGSLAVASLVLAAGPSAWGALSDRLGALGAGAAAVALLGLIAFCLVPRSRFPAWVRAGLAVPEADDQQRSRPFVPKALPLWHALHWVCWMLAGGTLALGLGATFEAAVLSGGVLCLAVVIGFLAVVAPAGAGVREVVISVGTSSLLGASSALVFGLTARVVSLAADFACWAALRLLALRLLALRSRSERAAR